MNKKIRIAYIVLTCEKNIETLTVYQRNTFFKNVISDDIFFLSAYTKGNCYYSFNSPDEYEYCPIKYIRFFKNTELDFDYYIFIDDDTFVNVEELNCFLSSISELFEGPLYIGNTDPLIISHHNGLLSVNKKQKIKSIKGLLPDNGFGEKFCFSGGGGFVLDNKSYQIIKDKFMSLNEEELYKLSFCNKSNSFYSDVLISELLFNSKKKCQITSIICPYFNFNNFTHRNKLLRVFYEFMKKKFITCHYVKTIVDFQYLDSLANKS